MGGIFYIEYAARLDDDFKKAGIVIQPPFNQLEEINIDAISNLSLIVLASSDTRLMGAYYYVDNRNMDDFRFFTLNIFDISYLFRDNTVWDKVYYDSYLNSTLKYVPNGSSACKKLINDAPAVLYYYQRDMGDNMFIPTKAAVICCNKKAYYLEAAAMDNVDGWFDKVEQAISFKDFAVERRYSIAFMVLLSIAVAISLIFVVREVMTLIKANKLIWINKRAHNHYKYIKATIVFDIIVALVLIILLTYDDEVFYFYGTMLIVETLVKNGLIFIAVR